MRRQLRQKCIYVLADFISANAAWMAFNVIRYHMLEAAYLKHNSLSTFLQKPSGRARADAHTVDDDRHILSVRILQHTVLQIAHRRGREHNRHHLHRHADDILCDTHQRQHTRTPSELRAYMAAILWGLLSVMTYIPRSVI